MRTRRAFTKSLVATGLAARAWGQGAGGYTEARSLRAHAAAHGRRFGVAVNVKRLDRDAAYARTVAEQCNIIVAENAMKWAALRPAPDKFDFTEADRLVAFAEVHGMAIRGHNLCWHEALPAWFSGYVTEANAEEILQEHIRRVVGRYRGRVASWDVVNEAIDLKDGRGDGLRKSPWLTLLGPRYLEIAFKTAQAADPQASLFYNDYDLELDAGKRVAVLALLKRLGGTVDGVGLQSHLSADSAAKIGPGLTGFVKTLAGMGLKTAVTELDVNDDSLPDENREQAVAAVYRRYLDLLLHEPSVTDVLCWGVTSNSSWLNAPANAKLRPKHPDRKQRSLPFTDQYTPQASFYAVRDSMDERI